MDKLNGINLEQIQVIIILIIASIGALISIAEIVVRFTPTESDDGAVKRIGDRIDKILDLLKVPNRKKDMPPSEADIDYKKAVDNHE